MANLNRRVFHFCKLNFISFSHKNNIYKHFQQHHGRKGNFDDVETIDQVLDELKQYIKKAEQTQKSDDSQN
jgi:hypothetical protein